MPFNKNLTLFVDVGGTKTQFDVVDSLHKTRLTKRIPTDLPLLKKQIIQLVKATGQTYNKDV